MDHIQRCLIALTAVAGALLAVFIRQAGPSVAMDRAMPTWACRLATFLATGAAAGHGQWRRGG